MIRFFVCIALFTAAIGLTAQSISIFPKRDAVLAPAGVKGSAHTQINPDGSFAVYGDPNQMIQLSSLSLSADSSLLAAGATPGTVDLWDVRTRRLLNTYSGSDVAEISRDGSLLATGAISVIEVRSQRERCHFPRRPGDANATVNRMHFSPDGKLLAVTINGSNILVFETSTCRQVASLDRTRDGDFLPDGKQFFAANYQVMTLWQVDGWKLLATLPAGPDYTTGLSISPNGGQALIAGPHGAKLVKIQDGSTIRTFGEGWVSGVSFLTDDVLLIRDHGQLAFWSADGRLLCADQEFKGGNVSLSQDGSLAGARGINEMFCSGRQRVSLTLAD